MKKIDVSNLRSQRWYNSPAMRTFNHRSRTFQIGYSKADFEGKPVIAIVNTWSDFNQCHSHFKQRVEEVKRGVWQAGGFPMEVPAISLSEPMMKPTTMLYRNLLAIEAEEVLRAHPVDGAVLMGGCDKTTPGLLMGAFSMGLPCIFVPAGPMLNAHWRGKLLGSGSDNWKYWDEKRAGNITDRQWQSMEESIARSPGHCMTMGTASTMTSTAEALGMTLPGAASIPAPDSNHSRMASDTGRRIVEMVWEDLRPADFIDMRSFENAVSVLMALGGSTNAVIHLIAMARRLRIPLDLAAFDRISGKTPVIANLRPAGKYLMEDFYYAGGLRALMRNMGDLLHTDCMTANGLSLGENLADADVFDADVIRTRDNPIAADGGLVVLHGTLAPNGAVIKPAAATPELMRHRGRAVTFADRDDLARRIEDPDLDIEENDVIVLKNAGPVGAPGMPEWGALPIPKKLLKKGVRDMLRISDARMSGTSFGACVLHVSPEAARGGPLALVEDGDIIEMDVAARRLDLMVPEEEMARRRAAWQPPAPYYSRGYGALFTRHVTSADQGCDFDFLEPAGATPEPKIY
ncbi:MAG TPA: L-arabinonate dehydratase [Xanthobacteraceae bacterium]|nr:L-arabinonate dehydratase [Xanthobacteraceae bacterium]